MLRSVFGSYRWSLLASAFGVAFSGAAFAQTPYTNSTSVTDSDPASPPPPYTLGTGDSLTNTSSGSITVNSGIGAVIVTGNPAAFINNSGLINFHSSSGGAAINVVSSGSVGTITNSGTISANAASGGSPDAITVAGSVGSLINSGLITSDSGNALSVQGGTIGSLVNSGVFSAPNGIAIFNNGGTIGSIDNSGTFTAGGDAIKNVNGLIGPLSNSGLIESTGRNGAAIANFGSFASISNSGKIIADNGDAVYNDGGTIGSLDNSGTITAGGNAINNFSGVIGPLSNSGLIQSTLAGGAAIANSGVLASINNSGTIIASNGTAILNNGTIPGGITNAASGLISGLTAIDNTSGGQLNIANAGTIIGAIALGAHGDTLNITGGAITGAINGQSGSGDTINFNVTTPFTTGGSIGNVDTLSVQAGAVTFADPVSGAALFAIMQGATATLGASVAATTFSNAGMVNVGTSTATVTGNYVQTTTGQLGVTVAGTTSGQLNVKGTATIEGHANALVVNIASNTNIVGQSYKFIVADNLVVNNIGSLTISDNSQLVDFDATQLGNDLVLTAVAEQPGEIRAATNQLIFGVGLPEAQSAGLTGIGYTNAVSMATALSDLVTFDITHGNQNLFNTLSHLSPGQWNQLFSQLVPSFVGRAQTILVTSMLNGGPFVGAIENRLEVARNADGQITGLAAGDEPGRGVSAWIQPYGGFASQDTKDGVSGFNATVYGVSLGGDTAIRPDLRVGLAVQLGNTDVRSTDVLQGNNDTIFTAQVSAYGTWRFAGNAFLDAQITYGHNSYDSTNYVTPLATTLKSSYSGSQFMGRIGVGYVWKSDNLTVTPLLSLQQYHFDIDGYNTSGGGAAGIDQHVNGQSINITQPRIGTSLSYRFVDPNGFTAIPDLHVYYMHNFGDDQLALNGNFINSNSSFQVVTPTFGKNIINVGAGVTLTQKGPWSVNVTYDHADAGSAREDTFYLRVRTAF